MLTLHTDYHTVRRHEVLDGISLFEELRIRGYVELDVDTTLLEFILDGLAHLLRRTYRNSRLCHDHHIFVQMLTDGLSHLEHILQIGRAVLIRRCANS